MNIKSSRYSIRVVISTILILMTILPLSSCGKNVSPQSTASSDSANNATSNNLDLFLFRRNDKLGYIDRTGKIVIPAKFGRANNFSEGLAAVEIGAKWGFIDRTGKIVVPARFEYVYNFSDGLAAVEVDRKWGFIDPTGKIVIPANLEGSGSFKNGLAYITIPITGRDPFTIDKTGKVVATGSPSPTNESTPGESDGLTSFEENNKYGYKDRTGKVVIPAKFDRVGFYPGSFNDGLAPVCLNQKCGYIDTTGKIVVPLQFDLVAYKFNDGLAWVNVGKKLGYIDKTGKFVIPARYGKADIGKGVCNDARPCLNGTKFGDAYPDFDRGLAIVAIPECKQAGKKNCDRSGYIDTAGKLVFEF
jgi:hypothetical protein